jgi:hypothetical protein
MKSPYVTELTRFTAHPPQAAFAAAHDGSEQSLASSAALETAGASHLHLALAMAVLTADGLGWTPTHHA